MVISLTSYLQDNKLLNKTQHGFQYGELATTNLLECDSYFADVLNRRGFCDVILFDFQRAFDNIDRIILCRKLQSIGINGCYLRWLVIFFIKSLAVCSIWFCIIFITTCIIWSGPMIRGQPMCHYGVYK